MTKNTYPTLNAKNWWKLRGRFTNTIPKTVTANYLSTVLSIQESSARTNVIPSLVQIGLIDKEGNTTELAVKWRDDKQYSQVCQEIRAKIYPQELRDAVPDPISNREEAASWFANDTRAGKSAVSKMSQVYALLTAGDLSTDKKLKASVTKKVTKNRRQTKNPNTDKRNATNNNETHTADKQTNKYKLDSNININIQIHISADASGEQIDHIFSSMAKNIFIDD